MRLVNRAEDQANSQRKLTSGYMPWEIFFEQLLQISPRIGHILLLELVAV